MQQALQAFIRKHSAPEIRGFGFVEITTKEPDHCARKLRMLGFSAVGAHRNRAATLYRQGSILILLSADPAGYARQFQNTHGTSVCAFAVHVDDAPDALEYAELSGAQRYRKALHHELDVNIPALVGPAHVLVYMVDHLGDDIFHQLEFKTASNNDDLAADCGLKSIEQITLHSSSEYFGPCIQFYRDALGLREAARRENQASLHLCLESDGALLNFETSDSETSPCLGEIRTIQLATEDIQGSVAHLLERGVKFVRRNSEEDNPHSGRRNDRKSSHGIIQIPNPSPGTAGPNVLVAQTLPVLGNVSFELVQRYEPQ